MKCTAKTATFKFARAVLNLAPKAGPHAFSFLACLVNFPNVTFTSSSKGYQPPKSGKVASSGSLPVPFLGTDSPGGWMRPSPNFAPESPVHSSTSEAWNEGFRTPFHGTVATPLPTPSAEAFEPRWSEKKRSGTPRRRPPSPPRRDIRGSERKEQVDLFWKSIDRRFEKCEEVGNGHFSHVFKVREKSNPSNVFAVKLVKQPSRFSMREWTYAQQLQSDGAPHPNLVHYKESLMPQSHQPVVVAFLLEFVEGETLERRLERESLNEEQIWPWIRDLLSALAHIHQHDMVHLDLKPENVFVTTDGRLKLGDFGQMIHTGEYDPNESMEGDVRYMAPELLDQSLQHITYAADMFSLGVVIWEMATSLEVPLGGCELWNDLRSGKLPEQHMAQLSITLQNLIKNLLSREPLQRSSAAEILQWPVFKQMDQDMDVCKPSVRNRSRGRRQSQPDSKKRHLMSNAATPYQPRPGPGYFAPQSLQSSHVTSRLDPTDLDSPSKRRKRSSSTESSDLDQDRDSEASSSRSNSLLGPQQDEMDVDVEISFFHPKNLLDEFNTPPRAK